MFVTLAELRHRITFCKKEVHTDSEGNIISDGQETSLTLWAKVLPTAAKISDGYVEQVNEVRYRIVIRYRKDIEITDVLLWEGKTLEQTAPPYMLDGKKKYLVLEARELVENGSTQ